MRAKPNPVRFFAKTEPATKDFAAKANDLQALRDAVVDAASVGAGLWLSYLFVVLYLAIAAGGVTYRDLLLENRVKLPFLNVDLPLKVFFVLGPLLFLVVHAYVLCIFHCLPARSAPSANSSKSRSHQIVQKRNCVASCRATSSCSSFRDRTTCGWVSWACCSE